MIKIKYQFNLEMKNYTVIDSFTIGADPRNDCIIIGKNFPPKIFTLTIKENYLSLCVLTNEGLPSLNQLHLEKDKKYLLEVNDHIIFQGHHFYIEG